MMAEAKKPKAKIIGADDNVFNLLGICSRALKENGFKEESEEMYKRVTTSKSYDEALSIMCEYIDSVDQYYNENDYEDNFEV